MDFTFTHTSPNRPLAVTSAVFTQVQRVQHRVALKKQQSVKLKRDLVQATQKRSSSAAIYSVRPAEFTRTIEPVNECVCV